MEKNSINQLDRANKGSIIVLTLLFMILSGIGISIALPPIAVEFYGTAILNTSNVSLGVNITAYDSDNVSCGSFIVVNQGYYGLLSCNGDEVTTSIDEGAVSGDKISFYINSTRMTPIGNTTWEQGVFQFVNLTSANIVPLFDFNLTQQYVNESSIFLFDVNCSDVNPTDVITYSDNTSRFEINLTTGYINWTPSDSDVDFHSVLITCSDGKDTTSQILNITVYDVNNPPFLFSISPQLAIEAQLFTLYIYANDSDRKDNLTFSVNSSLFGITTLNNSQKNGIALINFTPTLAQVGNYTVNISVTDGILITSQIIPFTIVRGPYCGDSLCGSTESCSDCSGDCGACETPPSTGDGTEGEGESAEQGGDGGGVRHAIGGAERRVSARYQVCNEKWECSEWTICNKEGIQTRACKDVNTCETFKKKPNEVQNCVYVGTCTDGIKNNNEDGIDCGGPCQPCILPTCNDGNQNQGEEGIDCGGPCIPCTIKKYAKSAFVEQAISQLAPLVKKYPWIILIILFSVSLMVVSSDRVYLRYITKKEIERYRIAIRKYKPLKRKVYTILTNFIILSVISSFYIYYFSDNFDGMIKYIWVIIVILITLPLIVAMVIRNYSYHDYKRKKREKLLVQSLKSESRYFLKLRDRQLFNMRKRLMDTIAEFKKNNGFAEYLEFYEYISPIYKQLENIDEIYNKKFSVFEIPNTIREIISSLAIESVLAKASKDYNEFMLVLNSIKKLNTPSEKGIFYAEEDLLSGIRDLSTQDMRIIISSEPSLTSVYNKLVDLYDYYSNAHEMIDGYEKEIIEVEKAFLKSVQALSQKDMVIESIRSDVKMVLFYNGLIDLYDNLTKKHESMR